MRIERSLTPGEISMENGTAFRQFFLDGVPVHKMDVNRVMGGDAGREIEAMRAAISSAIGVDITTDELSYFIKTRKIIKEDSNGEI